MRRAGFRGGGSFGACGHNIYCQKPNKNQDQDPARHTALVAGGAGAAGAAGVVGVGSAMVARIEMDSESSRFVSSVEKAAALYAHWVCCGLVGVSGVLFNTGRAGGRVVVVVCCPV